MLGFPQILLWFRQWFACLWVVTVSRLERTLDPVQRTGTLNRKTKTKSRNTQTQWSTCCTGPDTVPTAQGIQPWSTGYDTRSSYNGAWATFGGGTWWAILPVSCPGAFWHFLMFTAKTTKLNSFQMFPQTCWRQYWPLCFYVDCLVTVIFRGKQRMKDGAVVISRINNPHKETLWNVEKSCQFLICSTPMLTTFLKIYPI